MKEKDGIVDCPEQQVILYVEKEDGKYGPMQTGSFITRNFLDDYEQKRKNLEASLKERVARNEISPIHYYMVLEDLSLSELASRAGLPKRKVKKHLEPSGFVKIDSTMLGRYADVFNVNVNELTDLVPQQSR
jgi:hypothetical protein